MALHGDYRKLAPLGWGPGWSGKIDPKTGYAEQQNPPPSMPRADLFHRAAASNRAKAKEIQERMAHRDVEARPAMRAYADRLLREADEYEAEAAKHRAEE